MADPVFRSAYDFLAPSPDATYGSGPLGFFAQNRPGSGAWVQEGDNPRLSIPDWLRSAAQGVVGLGESTQTGSLTPEALATLTMGSVGTGATLGARGALASGASRPIRAYHGSPHDFDRFDLSKIGTGEGAQAYGHGLYFAENPTVASSYKNPNQRPVPITYSGAEYTDQTIRGRTLDDMQNIGKDAALQKLKDNIRFNEKYAPDMARLYQTELDWAAGVDPSKIKVKRGHMYEVDIHADPNRLLDWDKPLSRQSGDVQGVLSKFGYRADKEGLGAFDDALLAALNGGPAQLPKQPPNPLGANIYESSKIVPGGYRDPVAASQALRDAGVPGIRYLDGGSRTAGQGSHNYVMFDDKTIEILRKYGFAVPSPAVPGFSVAPPQPSQAPGFSVAKDMVF